MDLTPYIAMSTSPTGQPQHEPHPSSLTGRVLTKQRSELTPQAVRLATLHLQRHTSMESSSLSKGMTSKHSPAHTCKLPPAPEKEESPAKKFKKHLRQGFRLLSNASYKDLREPEMQWKRVPAPPKDRRTDEPYTVWWVDDDALVGCMICHVPFGMYFRRHHCRSCGDIVCSDCSKARKDVYGLDGLHRVCDACMVDGTWVQPQRQRTAVMTIQDSDSAEQAPSWTMRLETIESSPTHGSTSTIHCQHRLRNRLRRGRFQHMPKGTSAHHLALSTLPHDR
ncbi:hypothetical protein, variant 6 [Aphanomyces invadans]|uniref:FYVE-type domain-containing protein n=1 Tax=Aphanomyces invadans TaxID=157072 RepID=A0A024U6A7_9STRA|nr:hypothetical protein, variant 5 [Aphanomyces invadans]XP_008869779.1 hypothetical protein, variant 6 [Aphanomyces invadans]ETW01930.1 hypothetical protein, variant 5 [Aphanomyces invadans]ETW01931.1 hypothetical protein, variant 6 [Aphanomyces invadans]|eukprot:XP_008869778.1 hypothetical protein, variant 5 [Aphanomyces invadans]